MSVISHHPTGNFSLNFAEFPQTDGIKKLRVWKEPIQYENEKIQLLTEKG